jgi:hypothetical protein
MRVLGLVLALVLPAAAHAQDAGAAAWERIYAVAAHPRCTNCHVGDSGRPGWDGLGYGTERFHGMNIVAGESRIGAESLLCSACHIGAAGANDVPHAAPQIDDAWRLPPADLAWRGKTGGEICASLRALAQDGERLIDHVNTSAFVNYGFSPGAGRTPAPGSVDTLAQDLEIWTAAGAPCAAD